jgi:Raf kinase inhibitor-like YbhB/YbcL family protein
VQLRQRGLTLKLYSEAFDNGGCLPLRYTGAGENTSPPLMWNDIPDAGCSYLILMEDTDGARGPVTHWVLFDVPGALKGLPQGPCGVCKSGRNDFGTLDYHGPDPQPGDLGHHYVFRIYALDTETLGVPPGASRAAIQAAIAGHVLAEGELTAMCTGAVRDSLGVGIT